MMSRRTSHGLLGAALLLGAGSAMAQQAAREVSQEEAQERSGGRVAESAVGDIGQRQTREEVAPRAAPVARTGGRIATRVQSRIRNRIDRFYDPQANAASPFTVAGEQVRTATRPGRR